MSKVGKKLIEVPSGVTITLEKNNVTVTGPKGTLKFNHSGRVKITLEGTTAQVEPGKEKGTQYQGLYRSILANFVEGVSKGVSKKLEFNGIGYKANVSGGNLTLNVGYSHPVTINKVEGIEFVVAENTITVSGIDKVLVGDMAAKIRAVRPPEPYKGKGIKYSGEVIIRKETKSA